MRARFDLVRHGIQIDRALSPVLGRATSKVIELSLVALILQYVSLVCGGGAAAGNTLAGIDVGDTVKSASESVQCAPHRVLVRCAPSMCTAHNVEK